MFVVPFRPRKLLVQLKLALVITEQKNGLCNTFVKTPMQSIKAVVTSALKSLRISYRAFNKSTDFCRRSSESISTMWGYKSRTMDFVFAYF